MKKLILTFSLLLGFTCSAQLDFGLRTGVSLASPRIENFEQSATINDFSSDGVNLSYQAGVYARVKVLSFFTQGELYFSQINQEAVAGFSSQNFPDKTIDLSFSRLDLPLLVGFKIGPARIMGGPVFSANFNDVSGNINEDLKNASLAYQVGLGLELGKLFIDLRYEDGLGAWTNSVLIEQNSYKADIRTSQLLLCLGFELF